MSQRRGEARSVAKRRRPGKMRKMRRNIAEG
jgi:hypothetical protein